jgi:Abi-like protein
MQAQSVEASQVDSDLFEAALSFERFARYVDWASGDRAQAVKLYTLNSVISESLYIPLQALEIALRNRVHIVLSATAGETWYDDPLYQQGSFQGEQLESAKRDLLEKSKDITPSRVVAALTFGYWTAFFGTVYEDQWRKVLHKVTQLPDGVNLPRKKFAAPLAPIRELRNRVAHHEPILAWNLPKHYAAIVQLTEWLSPAAAEWCRAFARFSAIFPVDGIDLATPNATTPVPAPPIAAQSPLNESNADVAAPGDPEKCR